MKDDVCSGGECSPSRYVQQVLLEIRFDQELKYATDRVERIKSRQKEV